MRKMFTKPEECFSRQEATSVFREKGHEGPIDIGFVTTAEGNYIVWHCYTPEQEISFPVFKSFANKELPKIESFISIKKDSIFLTEDNAYYLDAEGEIQRIDIIFNAEFAESIYKKIMNKEIETIQLAIITKRNLYSKVVFVGWVINKLNIITIFRKDNVVIEKDAIYKFHFLNNGDVFKRNRMFWKVENGENGMEIYPLCVESPKNKNKWINIS